VKEDDYRILLEKKAAIEKTFVKTSNTKINPTKENNEILNRWGSAPLKKETSLQELLRRPEIHYPQLSAFDRDLESQSREVWEQVEIQVKYDGYVRRQMEQVERSVIGLSTEVMEKLTKIRPISLGQASRISGVTPAAISILMINLKKQGHL
jgi:tRNA uridine 5-carboxymethylaminomethyl modification enzyme